jgi:hypothetical protein
MLTLSVLRTFKTKRDMQFDEPLCRLVSGEVTQIWASGWLSKKAIASLAPAKLVDEAIIASIDNIPTLEETESYIRDQSPDIAIEETSNE